VDNNNYSHRSLAIGYDFIIHIGRMDSYSPGNSCSGSAYPPNPGPTRSLEAFRG